MENKRYTLCREDGSIIEQVLAPNRDIAMARLCPSSKRELMDKSFLDIDCYSESLED